MLERQRQQDKALINAREQMKVKEEVAQLRKSITEQKKAK